jgi:hypothetical protein
MVPMRRIFLLVICVLALLTAHFAARAADYSVVEKRVLGENDLTSTPVCNIRLSGPIVAGDAAKMVTAFKALSQEMNGNDFVWGYTVCLNSPGGS